MQGPQDNVERNPGNIHYSAGLASKLVHQSETNSKGKQKLLRLWLIVSQPRGAPITPVNTLVFPFPQGCSYSRFHSVSMEQENERKHKPIEYRDARKVAFSRLNVKRSRRSLAFTFVILWTRADWRENCEKWKARGWNMRWRIKIVAIVVLQLGLKYSTVRYSFSTLSVELLHKRIADVN